MINSFEISFDPFGNIYLSKPNEIYQININGKNEPYAELGKYKIVSEYTNNINTFTMLEHSLQEKVKNEENEEDEDNNSDYYPEENDHQDNNNYEYSDDEEEKKFNFSKNNTDIKINEIEDENTMALYDVFIYDTNLIFKSTSPDNSAIYRFRIFLNGDIYFRPIGYTEKKYKLSNIGGLFFV
jgi:hypothetical protein